MSAPIVEPLVLRMIKEQRGYAERRDVVSVYDVIQAQRAGYTSEQMRYVTSRLGQPRYKAYEDYPQPKLPSQEIAAMQEAYMAEKNWVAGIEAKYPSPRYSIEWTSEGATIYEKPTPLTEQEQLIRTAQAYGGIFGVSYALRYGELPRLEFKARVGSLTYQEALQEFDLPKGTRITAVTWTPEGKVAEYIPAEAVQKLELEYPSEQYQLIYGMEGVTIKELPKPPKKQDFASWLGEAWEGFTGVAVERLGLAPPKRPPLIIGQEPKTFVALKQIATTQEWFRQAPLPELPTRQLQMGGFEPSTIVFEKPTEPLVSLVDVAKFPVGVMAPIESFAYPQIPTPMGAIFSQRQREQLAQLGPSYFAGSLVGEYIVGVGFAKGFGKVWGGIKRITPRFIKEPVAYSFKFGRIAKAGQTVKSFVTKRLPSWKGSRLEVWWAKGTAKGQIEEGLIWGEEKFFLPGQFEVWESMQQIYKFTGMPIIHGRMATYGVIQVTKPTAFTQIQRAIERGMFPWSGQHPKLMLVTKKAISTTFTKEISISKTAFTVPKKVGQRLFPVLVPRIFQPRRLEPKKREKAIVTPKVFPFEMERIKFKPLEAPTLKPKKREKAFPALRLPELAKVAQATVQLPKQVQVPKQITIPDFPSPQIPKTVTPLVPPLFPQWIGGTGKSRRRKVLFGEWFKREHRIKTPSQMMETYLGVDLTRRGK